MKLSRRQFSKSCAALAGAALIPEWVAAQEQTLDGMLPVEITQPGRYVLTSNQTVNLNTEPAILVSCDDVEIDLQGYSITNTYGALTSSAGVGARFRNRVSVVNGTLAGFYAAVLLFDALDPITHGHRIQNVHALEPTAIGFMVSGNGCVLSQNTVTNPGGSPLYTFSPGCSGSMGIAIPRSLGCMITGNTLSFDASPSDLTVGVYTGYSAWKVVVLENAIHDADYGFLLGSSTEYRDNLVTGQSVHSYLSGQDLGNNQ